MPEEKKTTETSAPQLEVTPETVTNVSPQQAPHKKKPLLPVIVLLALLLVVAAACYLLWHRSVVSTASSKSTAQTVGAKREVFCEGVGDSAIQCEDQNTKEHRKYTLPSSIGQISIMAPSPDGSKFLVEAWQAATQTPSQIESWTVYDATLKPIATLPSGGDQASSNLQSVTWLDDNTVLYLARTDTSQSPKKGIYLYNVASKKQSLLMETDDGIERLMPSGDKRYVYAIQAFVNTATNSVYRKLVVINTNTKAIQEVTNNIVDVDKQDLAYSPITAQFYTNVLHQAEQTGDIAIYRVSGLGTKPVLMSVQQISGAWFLGVVAYSPVVTQKGIVAAPDIFKPFVPPVRFYTATGKYTTSSLTTGSQSNVAMYLQAFPSFVRGKTDEPVTADFFHAPGNTPQRIVTFVDSLIAARTNCAPGEYPVYRLEDTDGDQQFSASESGCGGGYGAYYALQDGTYKLLTTIREGGIGCAQRDRLGISKKLATDTQCAQAEQGL